MTDTPPTTPTEAVAGARYRVQLGVAARLRGEHVVCEVLGWQGAEESLARIRIVESTRLGYHVGKVGLMPRTLLAPAGG